MGNPHPREEVALISGQSNMSGRRPLKPRLAVFKYARRGNAIQVRQIQCGKADFKALSHQLDGRTIEPSHHDPSRIEHRTPNGESGSMVSRKRIAWSWVSPGTSRDHYSSVISRTAAARSRRVRGSHSDRSRGHAVPSPFLRLDHGLGLAGHRPHRTAGHLLVAVALVSHVSLIFDLNIGRLTPPRTTTELSPTTTCAESRQSL